MNRHLIAALTFVTALSTARAQPSFAGDRGKLSDGSEVYVTSYVGPNGSSGGIQVFNYITRTYDIGNFGANSDGVFSGLTMRSVMVQGKFTSTAVTGTYGALNFSASRNPYYGTTQPLAAYYSGTLYDTSGAGAQAFIMSALNQGELTIMTEGLSSVDAGVGSLDAAGNFNVPMLSGRRYTGRLVVVNGTASGTLTRVGYGSINYATMQTRTGVLRNISSRAFVGTGDNVLIAGFIVGGFSKAVVIRALGPTLKAFGVPSVLEDPTIEIHDGSGRTIATNDDWGAEPTATRIPVDSGLTGLNAKESGIVLNLDPGNYSVVVRGAGGTSGNGIVEVYEVF